MNAARKSADQPMKAYQATDGDEGWAIIFATNGAAARRHAAREIDCDFEDIEWCRRAPSLDQFAGTSIPIQAILDLGWWFECSGCYRNIGEEDEDDELMPHGTFVCDEGSDTRARIPVGVMGNAYCCADCRDWHKAEIALRESAQRAAIADLSAVILRRFPDAEITRTHGYAARKGGEIKVVQVIVGFLFPGEKYGGGEARIEPRESPDIQWTVRRGDLEAFDAYRDSLKVAAQ